MQVRLVSSKVLPRGLWWSHLVHRARPRTTTATAWAACPVPPSRFIHPILAPLVVTLLRPGYYSRQQRLKPAASLPYTRCKAQVADPHPTTRPTPPPPHGMHTRDTPYAHNSRHEAQIRAPTDSQQEHALHTQSQYKMAASGTGSLRMALGHRAMAKKYNDTVTIVQQEPVSPEVSSIRRRDGREEHESCKSPSRLSLSVRPRDQPSGNQRRRELRGPESSPRVAYVMGVGQGGLQERKDLRPVLFFCARVPHMHGFVPRRRLWGSRMNSSMDVDAGCAVQP